MSDRAQNMPCQGDMYIIYSPKHGYVSPNGWYVSFVLSKSNAARFKTITEAERNLSPFSDQKIIPAEEKGP